MLCILFGDYLPILMKLITHRYCVCKIINASIETQVLYVISSKRRQVKGNLATNSGKKGRKIDLIENDATTNQDRY